MLIRVRGPDGTFRITIGPTDTFGQLEQKVRKFAEAFRLHVLTLVSSWKFCQIISTTTP